MKVPHRNLRLKYVVALMVLTFAWLATPKAAAGHAGHEDNVEDGPSPIVVVVDSIDPELPGIEHIHVDSLRAQFEVAAAPGHEVLVLGYNNEPYLRVDSFGRSWGNTSAPSWRANLSADGSTATSEDSHEGAVPTWEQLGTPTRVVWHDHRIHWMLPEPPTNADDDGTVSDWEMHMVVDGEPVTVKGRLTYDPTVSWDTYAPSPSAGTSPLQWMLVAAVVATAPLGILWYFRARRTNAGRPADPAEETSSPTASATDEQQPG